MITNSERKEYEVLMIGSLKQICLELQKFTNSSCKLNSCKACPLNTRIESAQQSIDKINNDIEFNSLVKEVISEIISEENELEWYRKYYEYKPDESELNWYRRHYNFKPNSRGLDE